MATFENTPGYVSPAQGGSGIMPAKSMGTVLDADVKYQVDAQKDQREKLLSYLFGSKQNNLLGLVSGISGALGKGNGGPSDSLFNSLIGQLQNSKTQQNSLVGQFGASQLQGINTDFQNTLGSSIANLENRGLGASNLQASTRTAVESGRQNALLGLQDALLGKKLQVEQGSTGALADAMGGQLDRQTQLANTSLGSITSLIGSLLGGL